MFFMTGKHRMSGILTVLFAFLCIWMVSCTDGGNDRQTDTSGDVPAGSGEVTGPVADTAEPESGTVAVADTEPDTAADPAGTGDDETPTETEPETAPADLTLNFTGYAFEGENLSLTYAAEGDAGTYAVYAADAEIGTVTVPGSGKLTVKNGGGNADVTLTSPGTSLAARALFANGLPQLTPSTVDLVVGELTDEELARLLIGDTSIPVGSGGGTYAVSRLGIPSIITADGPCGVRWSSSTVWYPSCSLMASSWDREVVSMIGTDIGEDCIAVGVDIILGPGMNIHRSVLGGRNFEYFSEDPFLTGKMAAAYTVGVQSTGTGVSAKHYAVNNQESSRGSVSANLTERALRDIYLRGFGYLVREAAPYTVMSSYNKVNGTYTSINAGLLGILREDFGFDGYIMSDWGSGGDSDKKVAAGNDITMPGSEDGYSQIINALGNGTLSREACETAAKNFLSVVVRTHAYEKLTNDSGSKTRTRNIRHAEQAGDALSAAESGMVLLKNEGVLPYAGTVSLLGSATYNTVYGGAGSGSVNVSGGNKVSIAKGIGNCDALSAVGNAATLKKLFSDGNEYSDAIAAAVADAAASGGLALITVSRRTSEGEDHACIKGDWFLSEGELSLIQNTAQLFHKNGGKVLVILNTGNPIETASWVDSVDAVLWCGMAGEQVGNAVARIVSGAVNPSGKLTCTWPVSYNYVPYGDYFPGSASSAVYYEDIYVGYRFNESFGIEATYPFGYGLSYTEFTYGDMTLTEDDGTLTVSVTVTNAGKVAGREVVEVYVSKPGREGVEQPAVELCGFDKTPLLAPGESVTVSVPVTEWELCTYLEEGSSYTVLPGTYTLSVGASVTDLRGSLTFTADGERIVLDTENRCVPSQFEVLTRAGGFKPRDPGMMLTVVSATANGNEGGAYPVENMIDGDLATRWSGIGASGDRIATLDLGDTVRVGYVEIFWESNNANRYTVSVSDDGETFTQVASVNMKDWAKDTVDVNRETRYIRITAPASASWCSIYEVFVYGAD